MHSALDLRLLQTFVAVCDHSSFSRAAEQLNVTQPAVSQQIRLLEDRTQRTLVDRSKRGAVRASEAGRALLPRARALLRSAQQFERELERLEQSVAGVVQMGASTGPAEGFLPLTIAEFRERHPAAAVNLFVGDTAEVIRQVVAENLSFGIVGAVSDHPGLVAQPIVRDDVILVAAPGWLPEITGVSVEQLLTIPLIVQQPGSGVRTVVERELMRAGFDPGELHEVLQLGLQASALAAARAGYGATFSSSAAVERDLQLGLLRAIPIDGLSLERDMHLVQRSDLELSEVAQMFVSFAQRQLRRGGGL